MANSAKGKSHLIWLLKIVATVMVMYIHSANIFGYANMTQPYYVRPFALLANTGVPVFMLISGFLFFRREVKWSDNFKKKLKRLALPFLIWSSLWILFELAGHFIMPSRFEDVLGWSFPEFLNKLIGIPFVTGPLYGPLWYVRDLFIISVFAPLIQKPVRRFPLIFLVCAGVLWFSPVNQMVKQTVVLFIAGGVLSVKSEWISRFKLIDHKFGLLALALGIGFSLIVIGESYFTYCFYQLAILCYISAAFLICNALEKRQGVKTFSAFLSGYIFVIYVTHGKLLSILQIVYTSKLHGAVLTAAGYFLIPLICFGVCLVFSMAFKKLLPKVYKICTGE